MKFLLLLFCSLVIGSVSYAQLVITNQTNAQALAQRLVGDGVTISNVTLTGDSLATGFFKNISGTLIGLDSGIVLTNGKAKSNFTGFFDEFGLDGNGVAQANPDAFASYQHFPSVRDSDLANLLDINVTETNDACILEFDFVPVGDSIKFRYVFSSEEYPEYSCPDPAFPEFNFNDAFAFFIQGPGFPVKTNIALIPGTTDPVTINNINGESCGVYPQYYIDNATNVYFTHDGHTTVLTALAQVQPCQTYHLKLVIADIADQSYDSGVFLEAKSLTSNVVSLTNNSQTDTLNNSYIVEGCITGSFTLKRPNAPNYPLSVNLTYGGSVVNGVDVQTLPNVVTIPANDSVVTVTIVPIVDNIVEGIEWLKIYASSFCGNGVPIDSTIFQIRDYDTLGILPANETFICKGGSVQLQASTGNATYQWSAVTGLDNYAIANPVATPVANAVTYVCTATLGTCLGRDSVTLYWKELEFNSQLNVNCRDAANGQIIVSGGTEWSAAPVQYQLNNQAPQNTGIFNSLTAGNYMVHITDGIGCRDSLPVNIIQSYPDLLIADTATLHATCTSISDGSITITGSGGKPPYKYSINGTVFQTGNVFNVGAGTYNVYIKDDNNCVTIMNNVVVNFINGINLQTGTDPVICESDNTVLPASTNASSVRWSTAIASQINTLNNPVLLNPIASPVVTTRYYITATLGACELKDSVTVIVNPAPVADAGENLNVCFGGQTSLQGNGGSIYHWQPSNFLSDVSVSEPVVSGASATTTYHLDVTDANGCHSLLSDPVVLTVLPPAKLFAGRDTSVAIGQPLQLSAIDINNIGFIQYSWTPEKVFNNAFVKNPVAILSDAYNLLIVTAKTIDNCIGIDTIKINTYKGPQIYVANTFTPNGDGTNDVLKAFPVGIKKFSYFNIYNRFGQLVFSTSNENIGWNGKFRGMVQNMGTFVWIAAAVDYKGNLIQRKGTTTIIQ